MKSNLPKMNNVNLFDDTNLAYGIKIINNKMSKIIKRSTPIPNESNNIYVTTQDYQTTGNIEVYEGEDESVFNNLFLGSFKIFNLPKLKKGEAQVKISIKINESSILDIYAEDIRNTQNHKNLFIEKPKGLKDIIDSLKEKVKQIKNIDLNEYKKKKK